MPTPSRTGTPAQIDASAASGSTSVTVPSDCNLVVAFWSMYEDGNGETLSTLTLDGVGVSKLDEVADLVSPGTNNVGVGIWVSPATGSRTLAWAWSGGNPIDEGGEIVLVFYKDANTGDPVRDAGVAAEVATNQATVNLASTATTDRVVGFVANWQEVGVDEVFPNLTGATEFIDDAVCDGDVYRHCYDVGDDTGLSGTVAISNSSRNYMSVAALSLKASVAQPGAIPTERSGQQDIRRQLLHEEDDFSAVGDIRGWWREAFA